MEDLFETPDQIPAEIQAIFNTANEHIDQYKELARILKEVEKLGYTFDYGLDAEPYELHKIN